VDIVTPLIGSAIALGAFVFVFKFVRRCFRRHPEEPDEGGPYAGVTAPLRPTTPRRAAKTAVEEPDEPDVQD